MNAGSVGRGSTTIHTSLNVRGALKWPDRKLRGLVGDENGDRLSPVSVRNWLRDQLALGREVLPFGKACRGFDYKTGCPGHRPARRRASPGRGGAS